MLMLALLPGDVWKAWVNDSLSTPTPPTKRERGLLGVGAMPRLPPALLPGALGTPLTAPPQSSLQPGPWDLQILPQSCLAWESPPGWLIVPLLPLFLCRIVPVISILHAQRLHRKAWLPLGLPRRPADRAQVSCWRGLPAQAGLPGLSQSPGCCGMPEHMARGPTLFAYLGPLCLRWGAGDPGPSCDIGRCMESLHIFSSRSMPCISQKLCVCFLLS